MASTSSEMVNPPLDEPELQEKLNEHYFKVLQRYENEQDSDTEYDSEEEKLLVSELTAEDKEQYDEIKLNHIRQLVEYGRVMPIHQEIRRHMMKWLPGMPKEYIQRCSSAVHKRVQKQKEAAEAGQPIIEFDEPPYKRFKSTEEKDDDVLLIKIVPGLDDKAHSVFNPETKVKIEKTEEEEATEQIESEEEIEIDLDAEFDQEKVVEALKTLEETSKQQAKCYKDLREAIPQLSEEKVAKLVEKLPGAPLNVPAVIRDTIQIEGGETAKMMLAVGEIYLDKHTAAKYKTHRMKTTAAMARKYDISRRKLTELCSGTAYKGGAKTSSKKALDALDTETE